MGTSSKLRSSRMRRTAFYSCLALATLTLLSNVTSCQAGYLDDLFIGDYNQWPTWKKHVYVGNIFSEREKSHIQHKDVKTRLEYAQRALDKYNEALRCFHEENGSTATDPAQRDIQQKFVDAETRVRLLERLDTIATRQQSTNATTQRDRADDLTASDQ